MIQVRRILAQDGHTFGVPKTQRGRRSVAVDGAVLALLREHRRSQIASRVASRRDYRDHNLVVATQNGTPVRARNLSRMFKAAIAVANVPNIRFHDMRHTHASLVLATGMDMRVLADRLGHSQISFTMQTYAHAAWDAQRESAETVSSGLMPHGLKMASTVTNRHPGKQKPDPPKR